MAEYNKNTPLLRAQKAKGKAISKLPVFPAPQRPLAAPQLRYDEFSQYSTLQKEFQNEANGNQKDLEWKTVFLDLITEQELLEEYISQVHNETHLRKRERDHDRIDAAALGSNNPYNQYRKRVEEGDGALRFLKGLGGELLVERQQVLLDQAVNRCAHGKTREDDRGMWERILRLRREMGDGTVLDKYERGREIEWPNWKAVDEAMALRSNVSASTTKLMVTAKPEIGPRIEAAAFLYKSPPLYRGTPPVVGSSGTSGNIEVVAVQKTVSQTLEIKRLHNHRVATLNRENENLRRKRAAISMLLKSNEAELAQLSLEAAEMTVQLASRGGKNEILCAAELE